MGIPFYFGEIIAKSPINKRFNIVADKLNRPCSRFFLDFNSIIHPCSAEVVSRLGQAQEVNDQLYHNIFENIAEYTMKLIDIAQPSDLLYIAVDGVAPRAKMHQQRKRRFLSAQRNVAISCFKKRHNIPNTNWDSNAITPGTDFMNKLDVFLRNTFVDIVKARHPSLQSFIVSGSDEAGEGEHKMMHYIKQHQERTVCDVVYGLDADLIMLSLTAHGTDIVLMRESQDFGHLQSANRVPFKYLDISKLREGILETMSMQSNKDVKEARREELLVNDYVFMCYLLGNDFIPALSFLKIKDGAVDVLIECYKEVISKHVGIVMDTNDFHINLDALVALFVALKCKEDDMMAYVIENYKNALARPQRNFNTVIKNISSNNPHMTQKEVQNKAVREFGMDFEEFPLRNKFIVDINPIKDKKWRNSYYHYIFGSNSMDTIKHVCLKYLEGILWTCNYYFNQTASCEWYYHYDYAPCASDMVKFLMLYTQDVLDDKKHILLMDGNNKEQDQQYNAQHLQLLLVLPPQSKNLLPSYLRDVMTNIESGCVHYYPIDFNVMTFLRYKMWECSPLIPNINVEQIKSVLSDKTVT